MSPEAVFDTLTILARLETPVGPVLRSEVHLFAYLGCLLSLYSGQPVAEWGYEFAGTAEGSPFSAAVEDALGSLIHSGDVTAARSGLALAQAGHDEYGLLRTIGRYDEREAFIAGACASTLALPLGLLRSALNQEPALRRVSAIRGTRTLLDDADTAILYEQFNALSDALGAEVHDVMVPAVAWLTYLVKTTVTQYLDEPGRASR